MNKIASIIALLAVTVAAHAAPSPYDKGEFTLAPFVAYKVTELGKSTGKVAGGFGVAYNLADNIAIEASALSYKLQDDTVLESIDEAAVNFKGYLPIGGGLAPFGLIGYTRDHAQDRNLFNAGAGIEWRGQRFSAAVGLTIRTDFQRRSLEGLAQASVGVHF